MLTDNALTAIPATQSTKIILSPITPAYPQPFRVLLEPFSGALLETELNAPLLLLDSPAPPLMTFLCAPMCTTPLTRLVKQRALAVLLGALLNLENVMSADGFTPKSRTLLLGYGNAKF